MKAEREREIKRQRDRAAERTLSRLAVAVLMLAGAAGAQYSYFGKSKVQTQDYNFQRFETEHFQVLFYPGGETMAEFAADAAEQYYGALSRDLGVGLDYKVPLVLYLSPGQFSETNVVTDIIEEGVGGFSELYKNRIVLPFDGSYANLYHVVGHELTHIFEFQMYFRSQLSALLGAVSEFEVPLWVLEGFAEFSSGWANVRSEVFMRDLVINNRVVPLEQLSDDMGYLVYREGQSFFEYVEEKYGRKKVHEFMHTLKNRRNLDGTFSAVFGMSVERVSEEWLKWLRYRYWPQVTGQQNFDTLARRLTDHRKDGSNYNTAAAISPGGTKVAMVSDRRGYVDCYVLSAQDGAVIKQLVKGERSGGFENMHLLRPGLAWSPDERSLAVVAQSSGRDYIVLVDYATGRVTKRTAAGLDAVYSPCFSHDGRTIAFVGLKNGFSDVYTVPSGGGTPVRQTYDMYDDRDPSFSPGGDSVVFVSDRPDPGGKWVPGAYAVWLRDEAGRLTRLTGRSSEMATPVFADSGRAVLYSAADSGRNVYAYSLAQDRVVGRTAFLGEVAQLSLSRDGRKMAFSYFDDVGWDVAVMLDPMERVGRDSAVPGFGQHDTVGFERKGLDFSKVRPAGFKLSADYATGAASYSGYGGLSGLVNVAFSDMLGNHRFELYTDIYGDIINSDLIFEYWLLPNRADYGFTLFQFRNTPYYNYQDSLVEEMNRGLSTLGVYPFDKFLRAELGLTAYHNDARYWKLDEYYGWQQVARRGRVISYASPALVFDNTWWNYFGVARGSRVRVGADVAPPVVSGAQFLDMFADLRNYQALGRRTVFATRLLAEASFGRDRQQYYLGGEDVRGYYWGEFYDDIGSGIGLFNLELRYPFVDRLKLAFPLPLEISGIRGVAFLDGGLVFRDSMRVWDGATGQLDDLKLGVGAGIRIMISYFSLQLDFAKPLSATEDKGWKFTFGLGTDY